ncbi:MAG: CAP domain-containing protein [Candidatus Nanopelagicales bacterium]
MHSAPGRRRFRAIAMSAAAAVAFVGSVGTFAPATAAVPAQTNVRVLSSVPASRALSSYDARLVALINQARKADGVAPLKVTKKLAKSAKRWSKTTARSQVLRHDPNLKTSVSSKGGCTALRSWGENVAYTSRSADSMFAMYMNSPGHRANILDAGFRYVGVGTVNRSASWGNVHWNTMKFVTGRCR